MFSPFPCGGAADDLPVLYHPGPWYNKAQILVSVTLFYKKERLCLPTNRQTQAQGFGSDRVAVALQGKQRLQQQAICTGGHPGNGFPKAAAVPLNDQRKQAGKGNQHDMLVGQPVISGGAAHRDAAARHGQRKGAVDQLAGQSAAG